MDRHRCPTAIIRVSVLVATLLLHRAIAQSGAVKVTTAEELQREIGKGTRDVVLANHIDARQLQRTDGPTFLVTDGTRSIKGDCTGSPPAALTKELNDVQLIPLRTRQCLILGDSLLFEFRSDGGRFAMDSLYLRMQTFQQQLNIEIDLVAYRGAAVWMTNMTIQGEGPGGSALALKTLTNAQVFASGSTIQDWNGTTGPVALIQKNSSLVLDTCVIKDNTNTVNGTQTVYASEVGPGFTNILRDSHGFTKSTVVVQKCDLSGHAVPFFGRSNPENALFYSDMQLSIWDFVNAELVNAALLPVREGISTAVLAAEDNPLLNIVPDAGEPSQLEVNVTPVVADPVAVQEPDPPPPVTPMPASDEGGDDAVSVGLIAGIVIPVVFAIVLAAFFIYCFHKRNKDRRDSHATAALPSARSIHGKGKLPDSAAVEGFPPDLPSPPNAGDPNIMYSSVGERWLRRPPDSVPHLSVESKQQAGHSSASDATDTFTSSRMRPGVAATAKPVELLEAALDHMAQAGATFYERYLLRSSVERRVGGQGVVQFADIRYTHDEVAIKFYVEERQERVEERQERLERQHSTFQREKELYQKSELKTMMPATLVFEDNSSEVCCTDYGYIFPPFVIIERGQSLDEWARRNRPDFVTSFQALSHSVRALAALHKMGYAHRDIKPGNILRRPKQHDWTLIDFGCAAPIGSTARLAYSLHYASPEVISAVEIGCTTMTADAAVDMWAIGVIAFELLTGEHTFRLQPHMQEQGASDQVVRERIVGRLPLPWEAGAPGAEGRVRSMRGLGRTVLKCLHRDPARRPTSEDLLRAWDHMFDVIRTGGAL